MMSPLIKARKLYRDAYMRWCLELSHEKNVLTAKNICEYICNEFISDTELNEKIIFWKEVKGVVAGSNHEELMKTDSGNSDKNKL